MRNYLRKLSDKLNVKVWVDRVEAAKTLQCHPRTVRRHVTKSEGGVVVFWVRSKRGQMKKAFTNKYWINWADNYGLKQDKDRDYERFKMAIAGEWLKNPSNMWLSIFLLGAYVKGFRIRKYSKVLESANKEHWSELTDDLRFLLSRSPLAKSATTGRWRPRYELGDEPF